MKYKIKVSEMKKRSKYSLYEVNKNVQKFLLTFKQKEEYLDRLIMFKIYKIKKFVRTSVSFIHNRCVVSLRHVLCFDYSSYLVTKSNSLVLMAVLEVYQSLLVNYD